MSVCHGRHSLLDVLYQTISVHFLLADLPHDVLFYLSSYHKCLLLTFPFCPAWRVKEKQPAGLVIYGLAFGSLIGLLSVSRMISRKGTRFVAPVSVLFVITGIFVISAGCFSAFKSIVFARLIIFGIRLPLLLMYRQISSLFFL